MSEKNDEIIEDSSYNDNKTSVGEILSKARISKNISIEKISKDLRISKNYIEAVENDNFDAIPAMSYARGYVKTIAEYLNLDSDDLLKKLSGSKGKFSGIFKNDNNAAQEKPLTVSALEEKKSNNFIVIAFLIIFLLILIYLVVSQNNDSQNEIVWVAVDDTIEIIMEEQNPESLEYSIPDSLIRGDTIITESSDISDTVSAAAQNTTKNLELTLQVVKDSSYIMIISDGKKVFEDILRSPSKVLNFSATDSISIRSGVSNAVNISLNGKKVSQPDATGIWTFTKDKTTILSPSDWERLKNRISE